MAKYAHNATLEEVFFFKKILYTGVMFLLVESY